MLNEGRFLFSRKAEEEAGLSGALADGVTGQR